MITKKRFHTIHELQEVQRLAQNCACDVGLHSEDDKVMIDAKSYIGMYALDFSQPILVVSEDPGFHELIANIGETI